MKIVVVGLRGFPNIQGGIETHCEELYPRIVQLGEEVIVVRRTGFVKENPVRTSYKGVIFKDINSPFITGLEAAIHTLKGIWYAKKFMQILFISMRLDHPLQFLWLKFLV